MTTVWSDNLKTLDPSGLKSIFPEEVDQVRNTKAALPVDYKLVRKVERRRFVRLTKASAAAEHLGRLPRLRETIHSTMSAAFDGWALVGAILQLASPATIRELDISTLGFNKANAEELLRMLDDGRIGTCRFLCSTYFKSVDTGIFTFLHAGLTSRNCRLAVVRVHAKVLLFQMSNGKTYTISSSANLRSCRNVEVFELSADPDLHRFHQGWMQELLDHSPEATP